MSTVGVLCARGRVEEKALMATLAEAGIVSALFPPVDEPLPIGPLPVTAAGRPFPVPRLVVDRHPSRQISRAVLSTCRALGVPTLSAGIAATGDRLDVASALSAHGLPRPLTALCTSEEAALAAVAATGLPATLLPLDLQSPAIRLFDMDTAEAVVEHRAVLGSTERSLGLVQAGAPMEANLTTVIVIDGLASAASLPAGDQVPALALRLAEEAARVLGADLVGIVLSSVFDEPAIWDVQPVPDFRHAVPFSTLSVAATIARAVERKLEALAPATVAPEAGTTWISISRERMHGDVVVSA